MDNTQLFFQIYNLSHQHSYADQMMVFGAVDLIFVTAILGLTLFFTGKTKEKKAVFLTILGLVIAEMAIAAIHRVYFEPRPFITFPITPLIPPTADATFPSGHTTIMAVIAAAYTFSRSKFAPLFILLMLWVGFARIFVGVHYPLDILGGIVLGFFATYSATLVLNFLKKRLL